MQHQKKMTFGNDYSPGMEEHGKTTDFVPQDRIRDVISRVEALKATNINSSTRQRFCPRGLMINISFTCMKQSKRRPMETHEPRIQTSLTRKQV
jgi:hypothetical protein